VLPIPDDITRLAQIDQIDLSFNHLFGNLPNSFGQLQMLTYLSLSDNLFSGSIPDSFKKLSSIATLDLSVNHLSGNIPKYFVNFTYLVSLNLSFNNLRGQIPEGGVFSNITLESLTGNSGLCGASRLGFSPCPGNSYSAHAHILKFILPSTVALCLITICLYLLIKKKFKAEGGDEFYDG